MTEQEKFEKLVDALGVSVYQFGKDLGFSRVEPIYKILRGDTKDPGSSIYGKIKKAYPNVNLEWLVTGSGEMFLGGTPTQNNELQNRIEQLENENKYLQALVEKVVIEKAAALGKSKGANLCPDTKKLLRIEGGRMAINTARRAGRKGTLKQVSVRVPGALIVPDLKELFSRPL